MVDDLPRGRPGGPLLRLPDRLHQAARAARPDRLGRRLADGERRGRRVHTTMPAPAAQEGQRSRHTAKLVSPQVPDRLVQQDEFSGTSLDRRWSWVREPAATDYEVADGLLRFDVQAADLFTTTTARPCSSATRPAATTSSRRRCASPTCRPGAASTSRRPGSWSTATTTTSSSCRAPRCGRRGRPSSPRSSSRCRPGGAATATPSSALRAWVRTGPGSGSSSSGCPARPRPTPAATPSATPPTRARTVRRGCGAAPGRTRWVRTPASA